MSRETPPPSDELLAFASQAIDHIDRQSHLFRTTPFSENRLLCIRLFDGTQQQADFGYRMVGIRRSTVLNRITKSEIEEHTLYLNGVYNHVGIGRLVYAKADL